MTTLLWIPCVTIILTTCIVHVRPFMCTITLCSIPNFCGNGRECHTNPDTCNPECVCTDNITHEVCKVSEVKLSTNSPATSLRTGTTLHHGDTTAGDVSNTEAPLTQNIDCLNNYTLNSLPCPGGLPCFYGDCVKDNLTGNTRCECFPGATGDFCNNPCCLVCGPYRECRFNMGDRSQYCEDKLSTYSPVTSSNTGATVRLGDTTVGDIGVTKTPQLQSTDCLKNYTPKILPCPSGLPCFYGDCVKDNLTGYARCECYPGATGNLCTEPCCLDCGPYGECRVNIADSSQYCNCHPYYKGERCAKRIGDVSNTEAPLKQNADCLKNYTQNSLPCPLGLPCLYGDCVKDNVTGNTRCECYPGATGDLCTDPCCLDCGPYGECIINIEDSVRFCSCHPLYTGERCATLKPIENTGNLQVQVEKETWYLWLVGVCAVVLFMLLLLMIVLPYLMWKHRVILIMNIVHYFQPYEDQDDRIWDALVLYSSDPADEEFVLRKLYPTLEKEMGFKLNINLKDFEVGETIGNNIIHAVQNSRRTILVISKNCAKSEFTRFEYQCVQQEMLQKKHHIIPILLEDIAEIKDTVDPTLKTILNSVTYIMWSGENNPKKLQKFWKRLELSMPKRRRIKDEGTVWPENITIHATDNNKYRDVIDSTINKSVDEGQLQKVMKKDCAFIQL